MYTFIIYYECMKYDMYVFEKMCSLTFLTYCLTCTATAQPTAYM